MNKDTFNMSVRKFLKKVGVTSQREIEQAVRDAEASGKLHARRRKSDLRRHRRGRNRLKRV